MEAFMLIDLHAHSKGISHCCRIPYKDVLHQTLMCGMDGIVLTNHYQKLYFEDGDIMPFVEKYIEEFYITEEYGKQIGCKVFFGVEVSMELYPRVHMLLYGIDPEFLRQYPMVHEMTQEELYALAKANNAVLIQAHPFRKTELLDPQYMDGVEINCHPLYKISHSDDLLRIARENSLLVTCGGDYHADTYRPKCGMYLPDCVKDHHDLRDYLLNTSKTTLCVHEPYAGIRMVDYRL